MREIKFRAWSKSDSNYTEDIGTSIGGFDYFMLNKDYVIEQSTGLKDKSGTPIYEGDILRVTTTGGYTFEDKFCEVVYKDNGFFIRKTLYSTDYFQDFSHKKSWNDGQASGIELITYEVIGNIRQNKSLLEA